MAILFSFFRVRFILLSFCISLTVMSSSVAHILGNETDRDALFAFKSQLTLNSQSVLSSWNASSHFCDWEGVTCGHRHGRVIGLNLDSRQLSGSISPYIGNLLFLRDLNLTNNMLNGQVPHEVSHLSRLQNLTLGNNSLTGALPVNLSLCFNLQILLISMNKLTGRIPESYGSFRKLTDFVLAKNNLIGGIPPSLGNLSALAYLQLSDNNLTGSIPDSLSHLTKLQYFSAASNMLSGKVPQFYFNFSSLDTISLTNNQLGESLPQHIGLKLPKLRVLYIGGNFFSGSLPISLFTYTSQLGSLGLSGNNFSGAVPVEIRKQNKLRVLGLESNSFGSGGRVDDLHFLTSLKNCTNLWWMLANNNNFGGKLPLSLTNLSNQLNYLHLGSNKIFGSIPPDMGKFQNLVSFSLKSNALTGVIPTSVGMLQNLESLELSDNYLYGEIPHSIRNMSSLSDLDLSVNFFKGNIVSRFGKNQLLQKLNLDHNHLTGTIPKQLFSSCRQLLQINLSYNFFVGPLPLSVGNLESVLTFDLSANRISGPIPNTLGSCLTLQLLSLSGNFFHGEIPSSFRNMKSIEDIDLSLNNLSGQFPRDLLNLPYLGRLNLSFNNLEGEVPMEGIFRNTTAFSVVGNDEVCGGVTELHLRDCDIIKPKKKRMPLIAKLTVGVILPSSFVLASLLIMLYSRKRTSSKPISIECENEFPQVSYKELYDATSGFSSEMLIGKGSYGYVFKGVLPKYDRVIAVKAFNLLARGATEIFVTECETLRKVRHRNLLKILTVCSSVDYRGNDFKALVFEFMSNGSLESWLHPTSNGQYPPRNTSFLQRLNIALDIAFAMDYLHNQFGMPIVHCDVKPSNVLLNQDMVACLGDFGLVKFLTKGIYNSIIVEESISSSIRGTIGYIPPEYGMGVDVSMEGDVFSFGILILEMLTGKRPTDSLFNNSFTLHRFCARNLTKQVIDIFDTRMLIEENPEGSFDDDIEEKQHFRKRTLDCLISVMKVGVACSSEAIVHRMNVKDVVTELQAIKEIFMNNKNASDRQNFP